MKKPKTHTPKEIKLLKQDMEKVVKEINNKFQTDLKALFYTGGKQI